MANWIYRVEVVGRNVSGASTVFHYGTHGYVTSAAHARIPSTHVEARLLQPLEFTRSLYGGAKSHGSAEIGSGECVLSNSDGGLDALLDYGFDGQEFRLYRVSPDNTDTEVLEFWGATESVVADDASVRLLVRDFSYTLDRALQPNKFAGNNSLPNGLEGTTDDIGGAPKPIVVGNVINWSPPQVNSSRLIYQLHDGLLSSAPAYSLVVYDKGVQLATGVTRTLTEMQNGSTTYAVTSVDTTNDFLVDSGNSYGSISTGTPVMIDSTVSLPSPLLNSQYYYARAVSVAQISLHPTATDASANTNKVNLTTVGSGTISIYTNRTPFGMYDTCSNVLGSYFRLGSTPGQITCNFGNYLNSVTFSTAPELVQALLARISSTWIVDNRITIGSGSTEAMGVAFTQETTVYEAIQTILRGHNGSFRVYTNQQASSNIYVTIQRLEATGTPVLTIDQGNILSGTDLKRVQPADTERGIPVWRFNISYGHNMTVQKPSDVTGATQSWMSYVGREFRIKQYDTTSVKNRFPFSPELNWVTDKYTNTLNISTYLQSILGVLFDIFTVEVSLDIFDSITDTTNPSVTINGPMVGMMVTLQHPRFGLSAGRTCCVIANTVDYSKRQCELTLWGARP